MHIRRIPLVLGLLGILAAILSGCSNPTSPEQGSLSITITEDVSSRSIAPTLSMTPASYTISGSGPNDATFSESVDASAGATNASITNLNFGSWDITVEALNDDDTPVVIGEGSKSGVTINTGKTTEVSIAVLPLGGNGTFDIDASWDGTKVENAYLNLTITPSSGSATTVKTPAENETSWSYSSSTLAAGYYDVSLQLKDDGVGEPDSGSVVAGAAESVRIVYGQTTTWTIVFSNINSPGGGVATTITPQLSNPLTVSISRSSTAFADESLLNFEASQTGYAGTVSFSWYVNGGTPPSGTEVNGSVMSLKNSLSAGYYRVDAIATASGNVQAGSTNFSFWWKGSLSSAPESPQSNWAYFNTTTGMPYIWDSTSTAWEPFSTVPVRVSDLSSALTQGLGWDTDMDPPENASVAGPPGYGSTSFYSDVTGSGTRVYTALRIVPQTVLGLSSLTLNDIASISYWTKQAGPETRSWQLKIYTVNPNYTQGGDDPAWYKTRINSVILYPLSTGWRSNSTVAAASADNLIQFDKITPYNTDQKPARPISLDDVKSGITTTGTDGRSLTIAAHGAEDILFIDIAAGDNGAYPIYSYLDGIVLTTTSGKAFALDLGN